MSVRLLLTIPVLIFTVFASSPNRARAEWVLGEPRALVQPGVAVAGDIVPQNSNNNVSIELFEGAMFMAWRSSHDHFASADTTTHVVRSVDDGRTWTRELDVKIDGDVREAHLKTIGGRLHLYYFEGGTNPKTFRPRRVVHRERLDAGEWSEPIEIAGKGEVVWELKSYGATTYKVSYSGPHYRFIPGALKLKFERSDDGVDWRPVGETGSSEVYSGGVCEVAIESDADGNLWGIGRNEDGDRTGFGTQIFFARAGHWGEWSSLRRSLPARYDSPTMFRHRGEIYLVSRRAENPFDKGMNFLPFNVRRWLYLGMYSLQRMRTALFRLDREKVDLQWILDLPSAGDNAFPSLVRKGKDRLFIANYSSPLQHTDWPWIRGQKSVEGTFIYGIDLEWRDAVGEPTRALASDHR